MKAPRIGLMFLAIVFAVYVFHWVQLDLFGPSDATLISRALDDALQATREGRPGGVLARLSDNFQIDMKSPGTRSQIADFVRRARADIRIANAKPEITGDSGRIVSDATVRFDFEGIKVDTNVKNVTLIFHREWDRAWLLIPVRTWKLDTVFLPKNAIPESLGLSGLPDWGGFGG